MATILSQIPSISGVDLFGNNTAAQMPLGTYVETTDGRGFRYSQVGAVSTVPGQLYQSSANDATNFTPVGGVAVAAAAAIGDTQITISGVTITAAQAANLALGGFVSVAITPGQGYMYKIAAVNTTSLVITLQDPLKVALTTSSKVLLSVQPNVGVVVFPTTRTGVNVGIPQTIITNGNYGWLQTFGQSAVLSGVATSVTIGVPVTNSGATAGATIVATAVLPTVGLAMQTFTATEYNNVFLTLK